MRLHSLELEAFGPYATRQIVDFDRLAGGGLFLLEGPTGAGKSTVLDAISFALYGGLAGEDAGEDRLHSHFAGPDAVPSVTLEFSLRGVRYRVERAPAYQRLKRRGEGHVTEPARVHLQRRDDGEWVSLSSNKAEAGDLVTAAVGLNRAQFTQVMLLPQGEFARFLRSDDDARRAVLTRLFGTQLYDKITAELDRRRAEAVRQSQAAGQRVLGAVSAAAEAAGLDLAARAELTELAAEARAVRFKEVADELAANAGLAQEALDLAGGQVREAQAAEQAATRQAEAMARLTRALKLLAEHEAGRAEHDERVGRLAAARRAEPVRPLLGVLAEARTAVAAARERLRGCAPVPAAGAAADAGLEPASLEAAGLAPDDLEAAGLEPDDLAAAGLAAAAFVAAAAGLAEAAEREAAGLEHLVEAEATVAAREDAVAELARAASAASALVESITSARQNLPERIAAAEEQLTGARNTAADLDAASERQAAVESAAAAARRLAEIGPALERASAAVLAATDAHQAAVDAHQAAMDARFAGMAAELAGALVVGQACPVCGSAEHPAPAALGTLVVTAEAVEAARQARAAAEDARRRAQDEHAALDREAAEHAAVAGGRALADIDAEAAAVAARVTAAGRAAGQLAELDAGLSELRAEQERLGADLVDAVGQQASARRASEAAQEELAGLRATLAGAAGSYPSVSARQAALTSAARDGRALAAAAGELGSALDAQARAGRLAQEEALASGFAALELAAAAVLGPGEQAGLQQQAEAWTARLAELTAATQAPDLAGLDPAQAGQVTETAQHAAAALARARQAEQEARDAREALSAMQQRLGERLAELAAAEAAERALTAASAPVVYLAGLAKGTAGQHRKVALTTYVLRHWFEQVVAAANVRLAVMSSGRYELKRTDEGESRRERAGLTLVVVDRHTGEARSPRSLSGGETFYTSLALALGLADVVKAEAGGVDLETLFIDEGFGALDAETLDQVLGVIDDLRDRGRAVGIVSHVGDLKERIAERLEVRRLPDGSSALRVVA